VVREVNRPPALGAQENRAIDEMTALTVTNAATDADEPANALTYTLVTKPSGAAISADGVITWTPGEAQGPSTNVFTTRVTDNGTPALSASNTFTVVVREAHVPPAAPGGLTAFVVGAGRVELRWTDDSHNEEVFRVSRRDSDRVSWSSIGSVPANVTNLVDYSVAAGTRYEYQVIALNAYGESGDARAVVMIPLPPAAPSDLRAIASQTDRVDLAWNDNATDEGGFEIWRKVGASGFWAVLRRVGADTRASADTGLTAGTLYIYRLRAFSAAGSSAFCAEASASTPPVGGCDHRLAVRHLRLTADGVPVVAPTNVVPGAGIGGLFDATQSGPVGDPALHRVVMGFRDPSGRAAGDAVEVAELYGVPGCPPRTNLNVEVPGDLAAPGATNVYDLWVETCLGAGDPRALFAAAIRARPDNLHTNVGRFVVRIPVQRVVRIRTTAGMPGSVVTVPVELEAAGDENAVAFSLAGDSSVLRNPRVRVEPDAGPAVCLMNRAGWPGGRLGVALYLPLERSFGSGVRRLLNIQFTVASAPTGPSALTFSDAPVARAIVDSHANVLEAAWSNGAVNVLNSIEGDVVPVPAGDGRVAFADVMREWLLALRRVRTLSDREFQRADCAPRAALGDGRLTIADAVQASRYAAGRDPATAAGGPTRPAIRAAPRFTLAGNGDRVLSMSDATIARGASQWMAVRLRAQGDEAAVGFSVQFDPGMLSLAGYRPAGAATAGDLLPNLDEAVPGCHGFVIRMPEGVTIAAGSQTILELNVLAAPGSLAATTLVAFADSPAEREVSDAGGGALTAVYSNATVVLSGAAAGAPAAPTDFASIVVATGQINLRWTDNASGESGYRVLRRTGRSGGWMTIEELGPDAAFSAQTGLDTGTEYGYMVEVYNGVASAFSSPIVARTWTLIEKWRHRYFGTVANAGDAADTADPDGDAVPNLLEYALGSDPRAAGTVPAFGVGLGSRPDVYPSPSAVYERTNAAPPDVRVFADCTTNIVQGVWSNNTVQVEESLPGGKVRVRVRSGTPDTERGREFYRLRAVTP
jgi:hypothetical protein